MGPSTAVRRFDVVDRPINVERAESGQAPANGPVGGPFDRMTADTATSRPSFGQQAGSASWNPAAAGGNPIAVEQYRRMASLLLKAQATHGLKVIMVTSALPGEGKSLTAANLALTLCRSYKRSTLLVDADLRRPSLHTVFRAPSGRGLSDYLNARNEGELTTVSLYPNLTLLPAGAPTNDPMAGLSSARMKGVITSAAEHFEWVVIDTPPVTLLPDAHVLSSMVDGVVLVIEAAGTQFDDVTKAVETLGRERLLGVVLNRATDGLARIGQYAHYY